MLATSKLTARYGSMTALADIDLEFESGGRIGVFGHNGAGKTTLLRCLVGAIAPAEGSISDEGKPLPQSVPENVRNGLALVPQGHNVFPNLSVEQNLAISGLLFDQSMSGRVFEMFPVLKERRSQNAGSLSGGEQQMLALGMALMTKPRWLLLDEPSTGLAPVIVRNVMASLRKVNETTGTGLVIVEQNVPATLKIVDRAVIIKAGRVVFDGKAKELENNKDLWKWF